MAIILRFSKPWLNKTSPIILRFAESGNDAPVSVPINIPVDIVVDFNVSEIVIDRTFGIEVGISWFALDEVEQALLLAEFARDHHVAVESPWLSYNAEVTNFESNWVSNIAVDHVWSVHWLFNDEHVRTNIAVSWALPAAHQITLAFDWLVPDNHDLNTMLNWLDTSSYQLATNITWLYSEIHEYDLMIHYRGFAIGDEKSIKWGFHEPRWVCSTKYRPPVGKVTIRFDEPSSTQPNPVVLRFTASPNYCYWDDGGGLIDANPPLPTIDFKIPIEPQIRRSYLMQPQISCVRVSDGVAVVLKSVSISQSRSQWASSGSLAFSSRIDAERAANELLKISINGYDFYMLCESPSESKAFGKTSYSATGRGRLATLASPNRKAINYVNVVARSFIGLMADIVANTGWTVASQITDYPVPANAFSYAAKTPAEAINMMANSIGAMLDVNDETQTITVIPQWPVVPWNTASAIPDVILHDGVILEFNERTDIRPDANAVFVRGEQQGVAAKVKRFGTAGDNFAGDIVDKLITDNQAARMRATAELANAGNKVQNSIRAKVMADLPPMRPGMLIGVRKGAEVFKSVCESFSISGSINESTGMVTVNQTVTLLRNEVAA
ncbi:hypothetical protein [Shewanella septentrionalis]|uniref:Uncharacterized protein n=1 Tax=Shewanella septentrionalis TaxID=2952223 RepID=A0A9X2WR79_9GAMM|nr:hypothetical protein [Shewanella septentrionalis]MCT7944091.1 hypothetical protein [Shewanella septentrionalis]